MSGQKSFWFLSLANESVLSQTLNKNHLEDYFRDLFVFLCMAVETFNLKDRSKKSSKQQFFLDIFFLVLDF